MKVGIAGTGAIAHKHAEAYRNIGFDLVACWNRSAGRGEAFAEKWSAKFVPQLQQLCEYPGLDFVDVCTFPDTHLEPVRLCARIGRHVQLQKPIATDLETARQIIDAARESGIGLGVVSQHRFDEATIFLVRALHQGRLGKILEADAYVKWYRNEAYYARPGKGTWKVEGGGALINQGIHQVDLLLYLIGNISRVSATWQLGAAHSIESEDVINALLTFQSGGTGVLQASTALWPGYAERIEIHGSKGTAIISGDHLTVWEVQHDERADSVDPAPLHRHSMSGASDPMAISVTSFERQFLNFADAIRTGGQPLVNGIEGFRALAVVSAIYDSCRSGEFERVEQTEQLWE